MVITVFGATGMVGKQVVKQALAKNYFVKAFGRNIESLIDPDIRQTDLKVIKGYVFDEADVYLAVKDSDAIISVLGGAFDGTDKTRSLGLKQIITQMEKTSVDRIVVLGGLGALDSPTGSLLMDEPGYPEQYKPVSREHAAAYQYLTKSKLSWTFIGAPDIKDAEATGKFEVSKNVPPDLNNYYITSGDLAVFMLSEISQNKYCKARVGISN